MRKTATFMLLVLILALGGCSRKTTVPTLVPVHDTTIIVAHQRDSVFVDHFREVTKMGDTIRIIDSVRCWRDREVHDTLKVYVDRPVEVQVPVEVEKELSFFQKLMIRLGWVLSLAVLGFIGYKLWQRRFK